MDYDPSRSHRLDTEITVLSTQKHSGLIIRSFPVLFCIRIWKASLVTTVTTAQGTQQLTFGYPASKGGHETRSLPRHVALAKGELCLVGYARAPRRTSAQEFQQVRSRSGPAVIPQICGEEHSDGCWMNTSALRWLCRCRDGTSWWMVALWSHTLIPAWINNPCSPSESLWLKMWSI